MTKATLCVGLFAISIPVSAFAQVIPEGSRDGTNEVRSSSLGVPGPSSNPLDQYVQRQGLQDLGGSSAGKTPTNLGSARPAKKDELATGAAVNDKTGILIAKIEEVDPDGVIVAVGTAKVKVPADAFGHNKAGLLLDMTKAQFDAVVAQANKPL